MGLVILIAVSVDVLKRKREQTRLVHVDVEEADHEKLEKCNGETFK